MTRAFDQEPSSQRERDETIAPAMGWAEQPNHDVTGPLENTISAKRQTLQDLKSLLEDRGKQNKTRQRNKRDRVSNNISQVSNSNFYDVDSKNSFPIPSSAGRLVNGVWCLSRFKVLCLVVWCLLAILDSRTILAEARSSGES